MSSCDCKWILSNFDIVNCFLFTEPIGGEITVENESGMVKNIPKTAMERALDVQLTTSKFSTSTSVDESKKRGCYYTAIPHVIKRRGMTGQELTDMNLDKVSIHL